jgi:hypothetical protein
MPASVQHPGWTGAPEDTSRAFGRRAASPASVWPGRLCVLEGRLGRCWPATGCQHGSADLRGRASLGHNAPLLGGRPFRPPGPPRGRTSPPGPGVVPGGMRAIACSPFRPGIRQSISTTSGRKAGIPVIAQYGVAGFFIDFAAQHPPSRAGWCSRSRPTARATTSGDRARPRPAAARAAGAARMDVPPHLVHRLVRRPRLRDRSGEAGLQRRGGRRRHRRHRRTSETSTTPSSCHSAGGGPGRRPATASQRAQAAAAIRPADHELHPPRAGPARPVDRERHPAAYRRGAPRRGNERARLQRRGLRIRQAVAAAVADMHRR